jgi:hypothetical protein
MFFYEGMNWVGKLIEYALSGLDPISETGNR